MHQLAHLEIVVDPLGSGGPSGASGGNVVVLDAPLRVSIREPRREERRPKDLEDAAASVGDHGGELTGKSCLGCLSGATSESLPHGVFPMPPPRPSASASPAASSSSRHIQLAIIVLARHQGRLRRVFLAVFPIIYRYNDATKEEQPNFFYGVYDHYSWVGHRGMRG